VCGPVSIMVQVTTLQDGWVPSASSTGPPPIFPIKGMNSIKMKKSTGMRSMKSLDGGLLSTNYPSSYQSNSSRDPLSPLWQSVDEVSPHQSYGLPSMRSSLSNSTKSSNRARLKQKNDAKRNTLPSFSEFASQMNRKRIPEEEHLIQEARNNMFTYRHLIKKKEEPVEEIKPKLKKQMISSLPALDEKRKKKEKIPKEWFEKARTTSSLVINDLDSLINSLNEPQWMKDARLEVHKLPSVKRSNLIDVTRDHKDNLNQTTSEGSYESYTDTETIESQPEEEAPKTFAHQRRGVIHLNRKKMHRDSVKIDEAKEVIKEDPYAKLFNEGEETTSEASEAESYDQLDVDLETYKNKKELRKNSVFQRALHGLPTSTIMKAFGTKDLSDKKVTPFAIGSKVALTVAGGARKEATVMNRESFEDNWNYWVVFKEGFRDKVKHGVCGEIFAQDPEEAICPECKKQCPIHLYGKPRPDKKKKEMKASGLESMLDLSNQTPRSNLRKKLLEVCGSVQVVMRHMDGNGNGDLSFTEFANGLESLGITSEFVHPDVVSMRGLFLAFDTTRNGSVDTMELLGLSEADFIQDHWNQLSTEQQWKYWCRKTTEIKRRERKCALWNSMEQKNALIKEKMDHFEKVKAESFRMKELFRRGEHDLSVVASFLPKDLDPFALERQKKICIDNLIARTRYIQKTFREMSMQSRSIQKAKETLAVTMHTKKSDAQKEAVAEEEKKKLKNTVAFLGNKEEKKTIVSKDGKPDEKLLPFVFRIAESELEDWEKDTRRVARAHNIMIPDAETIRAMFNHFDDDRSGEIDKEEFKILIRYLLGVKNANEFSDKRLEEYWLCVDGDHSGGVDYEEFICWYYRTFGAPDSGMLARRLKELQQGET